MNIDVHHHFVPDTLIAYIRENQKETRKEYRVTDGKEYLFYTTNQFLQPLYPEYSDYDALVRQLAQQELDMAVLAVSPAHFNYELDGVVAAETSRICNDWAGQFQQAHPDQFRGMMTLPMQDAKLALRELMRAHEAYGLRGLEIAPTILNNMLDSKEYFPIYEYCAAHGVTICLHPYFADVDPMFSKYYAVNLIRFMTQTCLGLANLIFGNVFALFPALRVVAYHGGGHFPYQFGRMSHGYDVRPEPRVLCSDPPARFLPQIYFDTITHAAKPLQFLVDAYGADHVLIGTDAPYDMGDMQPIRSLNGIRLNGEENRLIRSGNARMLFGIDE